MFPINKLSQLLKHESKFIQEGYSAFMLKAKEKIDKKDWLSLTNDLLD
jgi:hypothetical protein